jgi:hypothetical protein
MIKDCKIRIVSAKVVASKQANVIERKAICSCYIEC